MKQFSMQKTFRILFAMAFLVASLCGPDVSANAAADAAKSIQLKVDAKNVTKKTFSMATGTTKQLKVTVKPASSKKAVAYASKNSKVVSVTKKGKLTAKKAGTAQIIVKVTSKDGTSKKTWVKIKVSDQTSISLKIGTKNVTKKTFKMTTGASKQLKVTVKPASFKKTVTYGSKNSKIVSVTKKGKLTAKKAGTTQINVKVTSKNGTSKKTWVKIKVSDKKAETPDTPDVPETPDTPDVPKTPDTPDVPETPGTSGGSGSPGYTGGGSTGYWPSYPSGGSNTQDTDTTINTQEKLLAALRKQPSEVVFQTDKVCSVVIPEGTYKNTVLIVDAPNATIANAAVYEKIVIKAIKSDTWIEKAVGNFIDVVAKKSHVKIEEGAQADIQVNEGAEEVDLENNGTIGKLALSTKATVLISGNNQKRIPLAVDEKGKDATVNTSVPLDVTASATIVLQLHGGAEITSTITVSNAGAVPTIVAALVGYLQVTNQQTGRPEDVLVTMPSPGDKGFETTPSKELGSITGAVKRITAGADEGKEVNPVEGAEVHVIPYERGVLESDLEAAIRAAEENNKCYMQKTSAEGKYTVENIPYGNYVIIVKADGLQNYFYTIVLDTASKIIDTITMVGQTDGTGSVTGVIKDAFTGDPVTETLKLYLRKGAGTVAGEAIRETETGSGGEYSFQNLQAGVYTIRVVDERPSVEGVENYINVTFNIVVLANTTMSQDMTITKAIKDDQIRFVLRWGKQSDEVSRDLDSHLVGPKASGDGLFHTYFSNKSYSEGDHKYADLDVDNVSWEGPETTTVYQKTDGVYHFYVFDYSEQYNIDNKKLAMSEAKVDIYLGGRLLTTYHVPDGTGTLWDVCTYDTASNTLTPMNQIFQYPYGNSSSIGLADKLKERLDDLVSTYGGNNAAAYFGEEAAGKVLEKIEEATPQPSDGFSEILLCFNILNQCIDELMNSTMVANVYFTGRKECSVFRYSISPGCSEILLSGDAQDLPDDLQLQFYVENTTYEWQDLNAEEQSRYQKKAVVTNSDTKARETYYIKYEKYVPNFNLYQITADNNGKFSWKNLQIQDADGKVKNVLTVTGQALELKNPRFAFYSSDIQSTYEELPDDPEYTGKLTATYGSDYEEVYYIIYGSSLEPTDVTDKDHELNGWYVESKTDGGSTINCIHIYGTESKLTTGAALSFNYSDEINSSYEELDGQGGYAGKFTVQWNSVTKEYYVQYHVGIPEILLRGVLEDGNIISSISMETGTDGQKIYHVEGSKPELGTDASLSNVTFQFHIAIDRDAVNVRRADSQDSPWDYQLQVTYKGQEQKIYIKYTQNQKG